MISLDTECTGLDLRHGAKPFLVTMCDEDGENAWWEWGVQPHNREPIVQYEHLDEIQQAIDDASCIVLQNAKFDVGALQEVFLGRLRWDWDKVYDTLLAGHLLASNQLHDLTSMTLTYLGVNIQPFEDRLEQAVGEARKVVKSRFADKWRLAKKGLPEMPSAKEKVWKFDSWLPRAVVEHAIRHLDSSILPPHPQQPTVGRVGRPCTVRIDRGSKWGNPFIVGRRGLDRRGALRKYVEYILHSNLLGDLPELYGQVLGCHCAPELCHGDVLRALCHPWWTVCAEYGNSDSASTLFLFKRQRELLKERGLWEIYLERLKILPIVRAMENRGITVNRKRKDELYAKFDRIAERCRRVCINVADKEIEDLPASGVSNKLRHIVFNKFSLTTARKTPKGKPSIDKFALDTWLNELPPRSKAYVFIKNLKAYRRRKTAIGYMKSYEKFWLDYGEPRKGRSNAPDLSEWRVLHPSLNPTGSVTLRWSSQGPNEMQVSKQEDTNLRYCFGPAPGREWWSLDAKNIELRIPAYEAGEQEMIDLFEREGEGPYYGSYHMLVFDILHPNRFKKHGMECKKLYESTRYQWVKNGNFAVQYGSVEQSGTADRAYHVPGAFAKIKKRFRAIHGPGGLNEQMIKYAGRHGYVETMPDKTVCPERGYPLRCTRSRWGSISPTIPLNYHVQGTAMWWMMKAMIRVQAYLSELNTMLRSRGYYMVMQVHDELVFDFPKSKLSLGKASINYQGSQHLPNLPKIRKIQQLMEQGGDDIGLPTPVGIEYHPTAWSEGIAI